MLYKSTFYLLIYLLVSGRLDYGRSLTHCVIVSLRDTRTVSATPRRYLYSKCISAVRVDDELTDWLSVIVGVRKGCNLPVSPYLFLLLLEAVLKLASKDLDNGVNVYGTRITIYILLTTLILSSASEATALWRSTNVLLLLLLLLLKAQRNYKI